MKNQSILTPLGTKQTKNQGLYYGIIRGVGLQLPSHREIEKSAQVDTAWSQQEVKVIEVGEVIGWDRITGDRGDNSMISLDVIHIRISSRAKNYRKIATKNHFPSAVLINSEEISCCNSSKSKFEITKYYHFFIENLITKPSLTNVTKTELIELTLNVEWC